MVSVNNLSVEFTSKLLFDNINFVINKKDKIALVGKNGAGKTTLLKIIAGLQNPTAGNVSMPNDFTVGYLPQHMQLKDDSSVIEEVKKARQNINRLRNHINELQEQLAERTDYESQEYHGIIEELSNLSDKLAYEESENTDAEIERTLVGLGFNRKDFNRPTKEFSGGWRMRIELAKILIRKPDLLLLDEPTNHLDIESIRWLENYLISSPKAVILVSHDKAFVDNVTRRTVEISLGKIYDYNVNYSNFLELRKERLEQQLRAYQNQQKTIQDTEEFIERFRYKATKSTQVQSRIKQLAKIERIEIDEIDNSKINLRFPDAPRSGDYPVIIDSLSKSYGDNLVLENISMTVKRGEKIAFVGKNGAGKSTLVKCLMNEIDYTGNLKLGHNVRIGYFAQNQAMMLDGEKTVFDTIDHIAVGDIRTKIRDILGSFMFGGEESEKKVKVLSGGERTRLAMIELLLKPVNLLILDEPTNHLDINSKEVLKKAIKDFKGTAIIVSHDRDFLNGLVDKVYEFADGHIREYLGGIYEFLEKKDIQTLQEIDRKEIIQGNSRDLQKTKEKDVKKIDNSEEKTPNKKLSYYEQREKDRLIRTTRKKIEKVEEQISELEEQLNVLETKFNSAESSENDYSRYADLKKKLEDTMSVWEIYQQELEQLTSLT